MDFKAFFYAMTVAERETFAQRAGTSRALLTQLAHGTKRVELGFADVLVALGHGAIGLDDVPMTENAWRQRAIREGATHPEDHPEGTAHG